MAKKATKKVAGKKAAKKPAETTSLIKATLPPPKQSEPIDVKAERISDAQASTLSAAEWLNFPFQKDPYDMTPAELENAAIHTIKSKHKTDAVASALLYCLHSRNIPIDHGWDPKDYYENRIGISKPRADVLISTWNSLVIVGVDNFKRVMNLQWEKLRLLRKAILAGKINKKNIESWLKKCENDTMSVAALEKEVRALLAGAAKKEMNTDVIKVVFQIPAYDQETVINFEAIASAALNTNDRGVMFLRAMIDYSSNNANAKEKEWWKIAGLLTMKEMMERVAPVAVILHPLVEGVGIGSSKLPEVKVYQSYKSDDGKPRDLKYCLATSLNEAKKFFGDASVREFEVALAPSLLPKEPFVESETPDAKKTVAEEPITEEPAAEESNEASPPEPEESVEEAVEPAADTQEEKPAEESVPAEDAEEYVTQNAKAVEKMITKLVHEKGITKVPYMKLKEQIIKKKKLKGLALDQEILKCLRRI